MIYVLYFSSGAAPKTGLSPSIITYKKVSDGSDMASPPAISEVGGGLYKFTATPTEALGVVVDGGSSLTNAERYKVMQITPNDGGLDAAVSSRATESGGNLAAVKAKTDNLPADPASNTQVNTRLAASGYTAPDNSGIGAIKTKTDSLPAAPAAESNIFGHVADALAAYDPPTQAELEAAVSPLALEAGLEAHVLAVLNSYDPPSRAEASADKASILAAVGALHNISVADLLSGDLSDSLSFPANSLADLLRKLFWVLCNRMVIDDAYGAFTAYKGDGTTPGVTGVFTDNGITTERSRPTWP